MKNRNHIFTFSIVLSLLFCFAFPLFAQEGTGKPSNKEVNQKIGKLQIPFIANEGQADKKVAFYANTFGGTVFVTKDGEIVYALPKSANDDNRSLETEVRIQKCRGELHSSDKIQQCCGELHTPDIMPDTGCEIPENRDSRIKSCRLDEACPEPVERAERTQQINNLHPPIPKSQPPTPDTFLQGIALKETLIGAKVKGINGEGKSATKINYFKGNDQKKWKSNISTYDVVDLGEIYSGIELKLKAYGNNVEKLFHVKPGANPDQIKINLSGIRESKSEVGSQRSEVGSQKSEVGSQKSEVRSQKSEVGSQKSEVRSQKSEVIASSLNSEFRNPKLRINEHGESSRLGEACPEPVEWACPEPVEWAERTQQNNITKGASGLWVNEQGQLVAETELGPVTFTKPVAYQEIDGKRVDVAVEYEIYSVPQVVHRKDAKNAKESIVGNTENAGNVCPPLAGVKGVERDSPHVIQPTTNPKSKIVNLSSTEIGCPKSEYGFKVASYDKTKELVIDPLLASKFLGGSDSEGAYSIAIDASGNVYVTGYTSSTDFPATVGVYNASDNGNRDVFVSKLDGGLTSLLASTYLGGSDYEYGYSLALDASGNVYVTGSTKSSDFPTTPGAYDTSGDTSADNYDVFVSKLSSDLSNLIASTFLGGSGSELAYSTSLDTDGNIYVTGATKSSDFPTTAGAYDVTGDTSSDNYDVFVSKLNSSLSTLLVSSYFGGSGDDYAYALALDRSNNVYVTGETYSSDFPVTSGAYDTSFNSGSDVFISKLDSSLSTLQASTYLGGDVIKYEEMSGFDCAYSLALDSSGNVYVAGSTASPDFPVTSGAYDTSYGIYDDAFISKLNNDLSSLLASTFLGAEDVIEFDKMSGRDYAYSLALDSSGNVYVAGATNGLFPTTSGAYDTSGDFDYGGVNMEFEVFISKISSNLSSLLASTYLGSSEGESARSLATDSSGNVYVAGYTHSSDFPTVAGAYDTSFNGGSDVFISKLDGDLSADTALPTPTPTVTATAPCDEGIILETHKATDVTLDSATLNGLIDGAFSVRGSLGFDWGTSSESYTNDGIHIEGGDGPGFVEAGSKSVRVDGLTAGTTYYYRIYKYRYEIIPDFTPCYSYGNEEVFTTLATPTPTDETCKAETITTDPEKKLVIKRNQSDTVTVSVLGTDGCPVEGTVVKARLNRRSKKKVSVTSSATTDADGKAAFTVTAYNKKGTAEIVFSPKGLKKKAKLRVKVK